MKKLLSEAVILEKWEEIAFNRQFNLTISKIFLLDEMSVPLVLVRLLVFR